MRTKDDAETRDLEVAEQLGIPLWLLRELELRAVRRSIAEEVFAELGGATMTESRRDKSIHGCRPRTCHQGDKFKPLE